MIKLRSLLKESNSLFKKVIGKYFLSIIDRESSSMYFPGNYNESMIFSGQGDNTKIEFHDAYDWSKTWGTLNTEEDVENFIKQQSEDE